jgi:CheY-like chemotaxis protein
MQKEKKILIVEDESIIAYLLKKECECHGYAVCNIAPSCDSAIEEYNHSQPDLILMDIHLSGEEDGIETTVRIKNSNPDVPIIYLTAYDDFETIQRARETDPVTVMHKPVNINALFYEVNECFQSCKDILV